MMDERIRKPWMNLKRKYNGAIILFRFGDYYEAYFDDARAVFHAAGTDVNIENRGETEICSFKCSELSKVQGKLVCAGYLVEILEEQND